MKKFRILFLFILLMLFSISIAKAPNAEYLQDPEPTPQQRSSDLYRPFPKPDPFVNELIQMNYEVKDEMPNKRRMIGRLYIPERDIYVALYDCIGSPGIWQYVTDLQDSACYFSFIPPHIIIADHSTQEFAKLTEVESGDTAYIIRGDSIEKLLCVALIDGHNTGELITDGDYVRADNIYDYICYTCTNGWRNIRIVGFERVGYVPIEKNEIKMFTK